MRKLSLAAKQRIRGYISPLLVKSLGREFRLKDVIVISGYFRSGTTWLAELISKSVDGGIVFEPFHIDHVPDARTAGFSYNNFRDADDDWPDGLEFVDNVLRGKVLNRWTAAHIPVKQAFRMRRLVIKLVSANQMLVWLSRNFDIPIPLLIIRHPCAVLASWLNRGWRLNNWLMKDPDLLASYPDMKDILDTLTCEEEYFAAKWCIDHYVPLSSQKNRSFNIVSFEKLALEGAAYLEEILDTWDICLPERILDEIERPSEKASSNLMSSYETVLSGWQDSLSRIQQDRVLRVVRDFDLDFYTSDIEPDYDRLFGDDPVRQI